jgi:hypothetical protein
MPRTSIWYGDSGSTKTSQIYHFAKYIYAKTGKITRLISADGGGYAPIQDGGLIDLGIVQVCELKTSAKYFADVHRLADGFWPTPDGVLNSSEQCRTKDWSKIGVVAIEGITSISRGLLNYVSNYRMPSGERAYKSPFEIEEEGYEVAGTDRGHYGIVHTVLHELIVRKFSLLPVDYVIFTSLVGRGESKVNRESIYGPRAVGEALTSELPTWVQDCVHLTRTPQGVLAWYQSHPDNDTGVDYLAKIRLVPELYPEFVDAYPNGYVPLGFKNGIAILYHKISQLSMKATEINREWKNARARNGHSVNTD